jgi:hypothetical protein
LESGGCRFNPGPGHALLHEVKEQLSNIQERLDEPPV